jgi:RNase P/RNase MRP subunit POP5
MLFFFLVSITLQQVFNDIESRPITHRYSIKGSNSEKMEIYNSYLNIAGAISLDNVTPRRVENYISEPASRGILSVNKISKQ